MAIYQAAGERLLSVRDGFVGAHQLRKASRALPQFTPAFGPGLEPHAADASGFVEIGPNKPLTIMIRHIYTGKYPKGGFLGDKKDLAVVSSLKDYAVFGAASRAVNFLPTGVKAKAHIPGPRAGEPGTALIVYQPAVVSDQILLSIEAAFDNFPETFVTGIADAISQAAGIPLFLPWAGYLMTTSAVTKLASGLGDALFDGRPAFSLDAQLNFNIPGAPAPAAGFYIMARSGFPKNDYMFDAGQESLVNRSTGQPYDGDEPYAVISLDGAARKGLENFAPTVASASILKRFFDMRDGAQATVSTVVEGLKLLSDSTYRKQADDLKKEIDGMAEGPDKQAALERYGALVKNIMNDELKPLA